MDLLFILIFLFVLGHFPAMKIASNPIPNPNPNQNPNSNEGQFSSGTIARMPFLLYQICHDKIEDRILIEEERYLLQLWKSCFENEGNVRIFESSKSKLE